MNHRDRLAADPRFAAWAASTISHLADNGEPVRGVVYVTPSGSRCTYSKPATDGDLHFRYAGSADGFTCSPDFFAKHLRIAPPAVRTPE